MMKEAKENIIENFRRMNYPDHHEIEVFLLNTLEEFESVVLLSHNKELVEKIEGMKNNFPRMGYTGEKAVREQALDEVIKILK